MAHPYPEQPMALRRARIFNALEELRMTACPHLRGAELAHCPSLHLAPELLRHRLHAVADPEDRHAHCEYRFGRLLGGFLVGRHVAARENDSLRAEVTHEGIGHVSRMNLAIDFRLAD